VTVHHLLADLRAAGVRLEVCGERLNWSVEGDDPPEELLRAMRTLQTGLRAVLTGKRWFGLDARTGRACGPHPACGHGLLAFGALDPTRTLPTAVGLLSVEGDSCWDRLSPLARLDSTALFAPSVEPTPKSR
jgi:hypothetical protein